MKKVTSSVAIIGVIASSPGCSGGNNSSKKVEDPCTAPASELVEATASSTDDKNETLRGIRSHTKRKVVLMPVTSKAGGGGSPYGMMGGGGGGNLTGFATEIMGQAFLNEGIRTVAWFKVSAEVKKVLGQGQNNSSPYGQQMQMMNMYGGGGGQSVVNDSNLNELIVASRNLGACYIVRPVILKSSNTKDSKSSVNPLGFAFGVSAVKTKTQSNAELDIVISIISTRKELDNPIIAKKTFSGRSVQVSKKRANVLDGITGTSAFGGGASDDQSRIAFYDTIDKIVEFLEDKMI